jgi:hypothetical protein
VCERAIKHKCRWKNRDTKKLFMHKSIFLAFSAHTHTHTRSWVLINTFLWQVMEKFSLKLARWPPNIELLPWWFSHLIIFIYKKRFSSFEAVPLKAVYNKNYRTEIDIENGGRLWVRLGMKLIDVFTSSLPFHHLHHHLWRRGSVKFSAVYCEINFFTNSYNLVVRFSCIDSVPASQRLSEGVNGGSGRR